MIVATSLIDEEQQKHAKDQSINERKKIQEYILEKKQIYDVFINFLENSDNNEQHFQNLINSISKQKQEEIDEQLSKFLQLIISIANNYHCDESLFKSLFQIIQYYKDQIKQSFSNIEIYNIFESNKKLLLFLFNEKIIEIDDRVYNDLLSKKDSNGNRFCHFFYPELKNFVGEEKVKSIKEELFDKDLNVFENFEEKRKEGENDTFICSLIRKDSVEEFVEYVNRTNISLNSEINPSLFETNSFLIENKNTTLIEYAAFFGSIQIFQYLVFNKVELKPSLWLYVVHSRNAELFHLLEENNVDQPNKNYEKLFCESIKCHHNEFADYIENNFLTQNNDKTRKNDEVLSCIMQFHNYAYFPSDFESEKEFFYLCSYNYHKLVTLFIKMKEESIKKTIFEKIKIYKYL